MPEFSQDEFYMRLALQQAALAAGAGEVPVGASLSAHRPSSGRAHNQVELLKDPTAHAGNDCHHPGCRS